MQDTINKDDAPKTEAKSDSAAPAANGNVDRLVASEMAKTTAEKDLAGERAEHAKTRESLEEKTSQVESWRKKYTDLCMSREVESLAKDLEIRDTDAALALADLSNVSFDEKTGNVTNLRESITSLIEKKPYLRYTEAEILDRKREALKALGIDTEVKAQAPEAAPAAAVSHERQTEAFKAKPAADETQTTRLTESAAPGASVTLLREKMGRMTEALGKRQALGHDELVGLRRLRRQINAAN